MLGMFTNNEAAKIIGLAPSTLKSYRSRELGPTPTKQGRKIFYSRDALVEWIYEERITDSLEHTELLAVKKVLEIYKEALASGHNMEEFSFSESATDKFELKIDGIVDNVLSHPLNEFVINEEANDRSKGLDPNDDKELIDEKRELVREEFAYEFRDNRIFNIIISIKNGYSKIEDVEGEIKERLLSLSNRTEVASIVNSISMNSRRKLEILFRQAEVDVDRAIMALR